jgi:hypothetical protein
LHKWARRRRRENVAIQIKCHKWKKDYLNSDFLQKYYQSKGDWKFKTKAISKFKLSGKILPSKHAE